MVSSKPCNAWTSTPSALKIRTSRSQTMAAPSPYALGEAAARARCRSLLQAGASATGCSWGVLFTARLLS